MIGPSAYLVRLPVTMVDRNVGTAIVVLVGCFGDADRRLLTFLFQGNGFNVPEAQRLLKPRFGRQGPSTRQIGILAYSEDLIAQRAVAR